MILSIIDSIMDRDNVTGTTHIVNELKKRHEAYNFRKLAQLHFRCQDVERTIWRMLRDESVFHHATTLS